MQLINPTSSARFVGICLWLFAGTLVQDLLAADPFGLGGDGRIRIPFRGNQSVRSLSLDNLPPNISHEEGKVSLVADFEKSENDRVPVYLTNGTTKSFSMETVALEIPIVLEAHLGNGHWERAETHNAYGFLSTRKKEAVSPVNFRVKKARYWKNGSRAKLRYALYQDGKAKLFSETFEGYLPVGEIDKARHDLMSASLVPEPLQIRYHNELTTAEVVKTEWYDKIRLLRSFGPCYVDLEEAQKWPAFVHESPVSTAEERELAIGLQIELLKSWPTQYDLANLHDHCYLVLKSPTSPDTRSLRPLCWQILRENSENKSELKDPTLAKVAWNTVLGNATKSELEAATDFLCVSFIARNYSPIREYKNHVKLLNHKNPYVRIMAANLLLSKQDQQGVVLKHYFSKQSQVSAFELVRVLHFDRLYNPYSKVNWTLWERALEKDIEFTITNLSMMFESDGTRTKLRKFSQSSVLPKSIKDRLIEYCNTAPNGPKKQSIKRLLDNVNSNRNGRFFKKLF